MTVSVVVPRNIAVIYKYNIAERVSDNKNYHRGEMIIDRGAPCHVKMENISIRLVIPNLVRRCITSHLHNIITTIDHHSCFLTSI